MRKRTLIVLVLLALLVGGGVGLFAALHYVPPYYALALAADPERQAKASHEMLQQSAALTGDTHREGHWTALFTAEDINGWMAVDLVQNHLRLLPPSFSAPRVAVQPGSIRLACRYDGFLTTVLSIEADIYLSAPDVVALRLKRARAGAVPMPLGTVLSAITVGAAAAELNLQWRQIEGDPVALIPLSSIARDRDLRLESFDLRDGAIYIAGSTVKRQR